MNLPKNYSTKNSRCTHIECWTGEQVEQEQKTNKFYGYETHQIESTACMCVGVQFFCGVVKAFYDFAKRFDDVFVFDVCSIDLHCGAFEFLTVLPEILHNHDASSRCAHDHITNCLFEQNAFSFDFFSLCGCMFGQPADWLVVESSSVFFFSFSECLVCAFEQISIYHLQEKRYNAHWNSNSNKNRYKYIRKKKRQVRLNVFSNKIQYKFVHFRFQIKCTLIKKSDNTNGS